MRSRKEAVDRMSFFSIDVINVRAKVIDLASHPAPVALEALAALTALAVEQTQFEKPLIVSAGIIPER